MALRLIIEDEEGATTIVPLGEEEVTIGREPGNTIQLTEQNVSRQHARLHQGTDGWVIEDLESYNGVKVNGVQVEGSVTLNEGDVVQIGDYHLALSNNVEQTTLNIERPGQAANEPNRVMPSGDLPRVPAGDAAAIATPTFTPTSHDTRDHGRDHGRDRDRDEGREGGGRGLMLVLGLVGVLGIGFLAFKLLSPGDAPKGNPKDVGTSAANDIKPQPTKAIAPDPPADEDRTDAARADAARADAARRERRRRRPARRGAHQEDRHAQGPEGDDPQGPEGDDPQGPRRAQGRPRRAARGGPQGQHVEQRDPRLRARPQELRDRQDRRRPQAHGPLRLQDGRPRQGQVRLQKARRDAAEAAPVGLPGQRHHPRVEARVELE
jgi:hypothetical protein